MKYLQKKKTDPLTGEEFMPKKSSQRFASPANRIKFNNIKAREFQKSLEYINGPLISNYRILEEILKDKNEGSFHIEFLKGKGFDFNVLTNLNKFENIDQPCLYKFMIINLGNDKVKIKRND